MAGGDVEEEIVTVRSRIAKIGATLACGYAAILMVSYVWSRRDVSHRPCPGDGAAVLVDSDARVLCLCRDGRPEAVFRVALGRGGVNKASEGDGRTPVGRYDLGTPRPSRRYRVFVPVAYPTTEEKARGLSGSDVGVHGPHLAFAWLRHATVWVDWTRGCIAVGTSREAEQIAAWVRANDGVQIWIS